MQFKYACPVVSRVCTDLLHGVEDFFANVNWNIIEKNFAAAAK